MEQGLEVWVKKEKELRSTNWQLQDSDREVKYSLGNTVNNIVINICGARWLQDLLGVSCCKLYKFLTTTWYTRN